MHMYLSKILIACCLILLQSCVTAQSSSACKKAKIIVSNFINSKQDQDWGVIELNADKLSECKCEMAPVLYYISRMHVVLPNSHALVDSSPEEFIAGHKLKMIEQLKILKACEKKNYLPLLSSMIVQNFDEEISTTAKNLKEKLENNS